MNHDHRLRELKRAIAKSDTRAVTRLVQADKDLVNAGDKTGRTSLHYASVSDQRLPILEFLLAQAGANVDSKDSRGITPFMLAIQNGAIECASRLLDKGADVNTTSDLGTGIVSELAHCRNCEEDAASDILPLLLEHGARINQSHPQDGTTALHIAMAFGRFKLAKRLIDFGADTESRDYLGCTPESLSKSAYGIDYRMLLSSSSSGELSR